MNIETICGIVYTCGEQTNGEVSLCDKLIGKHIYNLSFYKQNLVALCPNGTYNIIDGKLIFSDNLCCLTNGKSSSLALSTEREVYSWGQGDRGELGLGYCLEASSPRLNKKIPNICIQASSGTNHSVMCFNDGHVYSFGQNVDKQLGHCSQSRTKSKHHQQDKGNSISADLSDAFIFNPRLVPFSILHPVKAVACGSNFTVFLTQKDGQVWTCGAGDCGQLGVGTHCRIDVPTRVNFSNQATHIVNDDDKLVDTDNIHIENIICGYAHVLCLSFDHDGCALYAWGLNTHGQLGLGHYKNASTPQCVLPASSTYEDGQDHNKLTQLFADGNSSAALSDSNVLWTWGNGRNYRLFQKNASANVFLPTKAALLEGQAVSRFSFGPNASAVCVASQLKQISPDAGPASGFSTLKLSGNGLWDSGTVKVRFEFTGNNGENSTKSNGAINSGSDNDDDDDDVKNKQGLMLSASPFFSQICEATVINGCIVCQPPIFFPYTGCYSVTASLDGVSYLSESLMLHIYPALQLLTPTASVVNRLTSPLTTYTFDLILKSTAFSDIHGNNNNHHGLQEQKQQYESTSYATIPSNLLLRPVFVKLCLSTLPFTSTISKGGKKSPTTAAVAAAKSSDREVIILMGIFKLNNEDEHPQSNDSMDLLTKKDMKSPYSVQVELDFATVESTLLQSTNVVYMRPSISLNGLDYSRLSIRSTILLTHTILFPTVNPVTPTHAHCCLLELTEDDSHYEEMRYITLPALNLFTDLMCQLPDGACIEAVYTATIESERNDPSSGNNNDSVAATSGGTSGDDDVTKEVVATSYSQTHTQSAVVHISRPITSADIITMNAASVQSQSQEEEGEVIADNDPSTTTSGGSSCNNNADDIKTLVTTLTLTPPRIQDFMQYLLDQNHAIITNTTDNAMNTNDDAMTTTDNISTSLRPPHPTPKCLTVSMQLKVALAIPIDNNSNDDDDDESEFSIDGFYNDDGLTSDMVVEADRTAASDEDTGGEGDVVHHNNDETATQLDDMLPTEYNHDTNNVDNQELAAVTSTTEAVDADVISNDVIEKSPLCSDVLEMYVDDSVVTKVSTSADKSREITAADPPSLLVGSSAWLTRQIHLPLDVSLVSFVLYTPHPLSLHPQHCRILSGEPIIITITGLMYTPPVVLRVAVVAGNTRVVKEIECHVGESCNHQLPQTQEVSVDAAATESMPEAWTTINDAIAHKPNGHCLPDNQFDRNVNATTFRLPADILDEKELLINSQLSVQLLFPPSSDSDGTSRAIPWPLSLSPTLSLFAHMTLTSAAGGGGKSKPGAIVQYTIQHFQLVDGLESLPCVVRICESLPPKPVISTLDGTGSNSRTHSRPSTATNKSAATATPSDSVIPLMQIPQLDLQGSIIATLTPAAGKSKAPAAIGVKLSFAVPLLDVLVAADLAVDKKFPKGDKRKAGVYYVGCSVDDGLTFDYTDKPLLEVK